jgi:hypothetical protein
LFALLVNQKKQKSPGLRRRVGALTSFLQPAHIGKGKGRANRKTQAGQGFSFPHAASASGKWIDWIDLFESWQEKRRPPG